MAGAEDLLSRAGKEVQVADQLLTVTYPLSRDPKMLLGVMRHGCAATELAAQALVLHRAGELEHGRISGEHAIAALKGLLGAGLTIPEGERAIGAHDAFLDLLRKYEEAPTAFARKERLVVASQGFACVDCVAAPEVEDAIRTVKEFVYRAGKHVMAGDAQ